MIYLWLRATGHLTLISRIKYTEIVLCVYRSICSLVGTCIYFTNISCKLCIAVNDWKSSSLAQTSTIVAERDACERHHARQIECNCTTCKARKACEKGFGSTVHHTGNWIRTAELTIRYLVNKDWIYRLLLLGGRISYICQLSQAAGGVRNLEACTDRSTTGAAHTFNTGYYKCSFDGPGGVFQRVQ